MNSSKMNSAKFALWQAKLTLSAKLPTAAKCASHANGEFNLAVSEKQFSYEAKRNNLALQLVAKFS